MASYEEEVSEAVSLTGVGAIYRAFTVLESVNLETSSTYAFYHGALVGEVLGMTQTHAARTTFNITAADTLAILESIRKSSPTTLTESLTVADTLAAVLGTRVIEQLRISDPLAAKTTYNKAVLEQLLLSDVLRRFFGMDVYEALQIAETKTPFFRLSATSSEPIILSDAVDPLIIFHVSVDEDVEVTAELLGSAIYGIGVAERINFLTAYVSPSGGVTTWTINTTTGGVTEYQNYNFNSYAQLDHARFVGAADDGLYELHGEHDHATLIEARVRGGQVQLGGTHLVSLAGAYLGMARGSGTFYLKIITLDGKEYVYSTNAQQGRNTKVRIGKGIRSRYIAFELVSTGQDFDLDSIEFIPLVAQRRV